MRGIGGTIKTKLWRSVQGVAEANWARVEVGGNVIGDGGWGGES